MRHLNKTRDGIISALTARPGLLPQTEPTLLCDVIVMKQKRGDTDIDSFRMVCREFGSGTNATIGGAVWAMKQWVVKHPRGGEPYQAARRAFIADCEAVQAGTFGVDFKAVA